MCACGQVLVWAVWGRCTAGAGSEGCGECSVRAGAAGRLKWTSLYVKHNSLRGVEHLWTNGSERWILECPVAVTDPKNAGLRDGVCAPPVSVERA